MKKKPWNLSRTGPDKIAFNIMAYVVILVLTLFCLVPFLLIISGSFTSQESILRDGYQLIPGDFSLEAYVFELYHMLLLPGNACISSRCPLRTSARRRCGPGRRTSVRGRHRGCCWRRC